MQGLKAIMIVLALLPIMAQTKVFPLPASDNERTLREIDIIYSEPTDTLKDIANRHEVSVRILKSFNPFLENELTPWTMIFIPGVKLPEVERSGIIINRAENRLYYFPSQKEEVWVFPVALGRNGWETPLGESTIVERRKDPVWYVPETIQMAMEEKGIFLPDVVRSGPLNPLGKYALRTGLAKRRILIHGTNNPKSIGRSVSSGCIRMYNEHVEQLFHAVDVGTPVKIIEQINETAFEKQQVLENFQKQGQEFATPNNTAFFDSIELPHMINSSDDIFTVP